MSARSTSTPSAVREPLGDRAHRRAGRGHSGGGGGVSETIFARPKSTIFTFPSRRTIFAGLHRDHVPAPCAAASPAAICPAMSVGLVDGERTALDALLQGLSS